MQNLRDVLNPPACHAPCLSQGTIRESPEDFVVEEIPAYPASGDGSHLFLLIEKRGVATPDLIRHVARVLQINRRDIGCAGQKDRHAVTRQFLSVPAVCETAIAGITTDGIRVLQHTRHRNKLKTGHLSGNRFQLTLSKPAGDWSDDELHRMQSRLQQLQQQGFANYFGPQRFGHNEATLHQGLDLLRHGSDPPRRLKRVQPWLKRMALSSVQSAVFNRVTALRVDAGSVAQPMPGDVVIRKGGSRPFLFQPTTEAVTGEANQADCEQPTLVPAGPLPGPEMIAATGKIAESERTVLESLELTESSFVPFRKLCRGTRRAMMAYPESATACRAEDGRLRISFELPAGIYATTLLRELFERIDDACGRERVDAADDAA